MTQGLPKCLMSADLPLLTRVWPQDELEANDRGAGTEGSWQGRDCDLGSHRQGWR
jgi:hypothetical protein